MKKLHILFMTVCCVAAMVSCGKAETETPIKPETEPEQKEEKEEEEATKVVLYGSLGETTKTYLSPTDETLESATFKVLWEKYDAIAIIMGGKKTAEYDTQGQGVVKAKFEFKVTDPAGTELNKEDEFEAIYPAGLVNSKIGDALSLVWPAEQEYKVISGSNPGEAGNNPMWASAKVAKEDEGVTEMKFYNLGGVVRFKLSQPAEDFNVVMATISADQPLSGAFDLKEITIIEDEESKSIRKAEINSNGSEDIFIKPTAPVSISTSGEASFYFAVPEGIYTGVEITLYGDNGKNIRAKLAADKSLEVKRSEIVRLKATGVATSAIIEGSNCFIGEGNVPIVITAMGNAFDGSGNALDGNNADAKWVSLASKGVEGCKIVWETKNTSEQVAAGSKTIIKSATFADGVLTVIPTGTPGNALVAVTDGENGTGNIVWSYHIWVPETNVNNVSVFNNNGTYMVMDRNIGALIVADKDSTAAENTKSIGLMYQWGRKDPLLGFSDFSWNMMNSVAWKDYIMEKPATDANANLLCSIKNPQKMMIHSNAPTNSNASVEQTWLHDMNYVYLWGYPESSSNSKTVIEDRLDIKTVYDPCPEGYRVIGVDQLYSILGSQSNINPTIYSSSKIWIKNGLSFPEVTTIDGGKGDKYTYTHNIQIWSATSKVSSNGYKNCMSWPVNHNGNYIMGGSSYSEGFFRISSANVRCIKDQSLSGGYSFNVIAHEDINFFD